MKIQKINAYQAQTSKADSCSKPSFKGTGQVSARIGVETDDFLAGIKYYFKGHSSTAIIEETDFGKGIKHLKASFPQEKDGTILRAFANFTERLYKNEDVRFSYTTKQHALTEAQLERINIEPTYKY